MSERFSHLRRRLLASGLAAASTLGLGLRPARARRAFPAPQAAVSLRFEVTPDPAAKAAQQGAQGL